MPHRTVLEVDPMQRYRVYQRVICVAMLNLTSMPVVRAFSRARIARLTVANGVGASPGVGPFFVRSLLGVLSRAHVDLP